MCWPVLVLGKIEKAVFTTVEVLWGWWKTIYVKERRGKSFFPSCCEARVGLFKCQGRSRKQFSLLWKTCEACASQFMWGKDLVTPFYPPRRICEHVLSCSCAREDRESRFHRCEGPVGLVQACIYAGTTWWRRFNLLGGAVKHVEACLSFRDHRESSFHRSESLVQACLCAGYPCKAVLPSDEVL